MYLAIPKVCSGEVIYCPKAKESPPWVDDCGLSGHQQSQDIPRLASGGWVVKECWGQWEFSHNSSEITSSAACTTEASNTGQSGHAAAMRKDNIKCHFQALTMS